MYFHLAFDLRDLYASPWSPYHACNTATVNSHVIVFLVYFHLAFDLRDLRVTMATRVASANTPATRQQYKLTLDCVCVCASCTFSWLAPVCNAVTVDSHLTVCLVYFHLAFDLRDLYASPWSPYHAWKHCNSINSH